MSCLESPGVTTLATGSVDDLKPSHVLPPLTDPAAFDPSSILIGSSFAAVGLVAIEPGVGGFNSVALDSIVIDVIPGDDLPDMAVGGVEIPPRFSRSLSRDLITSLPEDCCPPALDVGVFARSFIRSSIPASEPFDALPDDVVVDADAEPFVISTTSINDPSGILM
jgi:hypothetical protein